MKFRKFLFISGVLLASLMILGTAKVSAFDPFHISGSGGVTPVCGAGDVSHAEACIPQSADPFTGNHGVIIRAAVLLSWIIGLAAVVAIVYGGLQYIMSRGDAQKAAEARNIILYACLGLLVAVIAQALISFTINRLD